MICHFAGSPVWKEQLGQRRVWLARLGSEGPTKEMKEGVDHPGGEVGLREGCRHPEDGQHGCWR